MDSEDILISFCPSEKSALILEQNLPDVDMENLSKDDLMHMLRETKAHCIFVEESNEKLRESVSKLENALDEQHEKCRNLEEDKSFLRSNIKKASANWFERKAKISEGENDSGSTENASSEENDSGNESETKRNRKDGAHILITEEAVKLFSELKFKDEQLELSDRRCSELNKRLKDYEKVIDDHEVIIHGLEKQLDTYFSDNQKMSKQLADMHKLFIDLEAINERQVNVPDAAQEAGSSIEYLPTPEEFKEMSGSVTKTYIKLKELIYEKKSLVTEIERLQTLNIELQNRVSQQETRLISVSDALQTTWLLVSNLKDEHAKIHTAETILRYELKEKREILRRLREELECSREQWHIIRQKNSETEQEWTILREELNERRRLRKFAEMNGDALITSDEIEGAVGLPKKSDFEFEPPVDLLVDMGIEYGVVDADDEEPTTAIAVIDGEDVHEHRLLNLEEQCCFLYQKLMSSTSRALTLASRLSSLHEHYAMSDDEEENEEEEDEEEEDVDGQYFGEDEEDVNIYETEIVTPYVDSHDAIQGTSGAGSTAGAEGISSTMEEQALTDIPRADSPELMDDNNDLLSRRLITFLPRKIEILRAENKKLEERLQQQQDEKVKIEARLNTAVEFERRQRRQLEQQLSHLGKCVDELKLERNGKIAKVEEELRKKIEQVEIEEKEHVQLRDRFEDLQEKYVERGDLLQITASQLEQTVKQSEEKLSDLQQEILNLKNEIIQERYIPKLTKICQTDSQPPETAAAHVTNQNIQCELGTEVNRAKEAQPLGTQDEQIRRQGEMVTGGGFAPALIMNVESQYKKLVILTDACLRIPFELSTETFLCWSFDVAPQEIKLSIAFSDRRLQETVLSSSIYPGERTLISEASSEITSDDVSSNYQISKELLVPHLIKASSSPTTGRIIPKIPGQYWLIFQNSSRETQEIHLKIWFELSMKQNP